MNVLDDPPRTAVRRNGWTYVNQHVQRFDTLPPLAQTDGNTDDEAATNNNNPEGATGLRTSILEASERLKLPPGSRRKKRKSPSEPSVRRPKRPRVGETQGQATQDLSSEQDVSVVQEIDAPRDPSAALPVKVVVTDWSWLKEPPPTWCVNLDQVPGMIKDSLIWQLKSRKRLPLDSPFRKDPFFMPRFSFAPEIGNEAMNDLTHPAPPSTNVSPSPFRGPYLDSSDADARSEFLLTGASLVERYTSKSTWDGAKDLELLTKQRYLKSKAKYQHTDSSKRMLLADKGRGEFPFAAYLRTRHSIPTCFRIPLPKTILVSHDARADMIFEIFGIVREPQGHWGPASPPAFIEIADLFFPQYPESLRVVPSNFCRAESPLDISTLRQMAECELLLSKEHHNKNIIRAIVRAIPKASIQPTDNQRSDQKDPTTGGWPPPPHEVGRYDMMAYQTFRIPPRVIVPFSRYVLDRDISDRGDDWASPFG
ncbi:hypothetical protein PV10_06631 [Exophiala mesophila]|uniref:Uncharacterized protein n=1 Tax=Exophiala mesophila TaxID=212818 RepID=A0A0D1WSK6_EXOME|nr:uncharacterized protein PV10_06631 [Exophiala mesophila]KIV92170.1 hypothetical protein PV10_06631 [Exophiala mesophila]